MNDSLQQFVDSGQLAGAATLVWKNGAAHTRCFGWRDIERKLCLVVLNTRTILKPFGGKFGIGSSVGR